MQVLFLRPLRECWEKHPQAEGPLRTWYAMVLEAKWTNTADVKRQFPSADPVGDKRIVFNIKGNNFRLVARVVYAPYYRVMVKFVGTHAEYDRIDAKTVGRPVRRG